MRFGLVFLALCLVAGVAPAAIEVEVARHADVDYSKYQSFSFKVKEGMPPDQPLGENGATLKVVREEAAKVLLGRGLTRVEGGDADMWITFFGLVQESLSVEGSRKGVGGGVTWVGDPGAHSSRTVIQGTLLVEIFDGESGERIWSGWATAEAAQRGKLRARAGKATRKILEEFPKK